MPLMKFFSEEIGGTPLSSLDRALQDLIQARLLSGGGDLYGDNAMLKIRYESWTV
jgi:hypothetical protein